MDRSKRRNPRALQPRPDALESRTLLSHVVVPTQKAQIRAVIDRPGYTQLIRPNTIGVPLSFLGTTAAKYAGFVDPTVTIKNGVHVVVNHNTLVAPFAVLDASAGFIKIGTGSEVADSARLIANPTQAAGAVGIQVGDQTLIGDNATVLGPSVVGGYGDAALTTVVGPGALVDGATIQPGAVVSELARVGPGVTVPKGIRVLPGKNVTTEAEATDPALGKVVALGGPDDPLNADVTSIANAAKELSAASTLASGYSALYAGNSNTVLGTGPSPGSAGTTPSFLNPKYNFLGTALPSPQFRGRATGTVNFGSLALQINPVLGSGNSFRGDEGSPITITSIAHTGSHLVVRAPISGSAKIGSNFAAGNDVTILGGPLTAAAGANPQIGPTTIGNNVTVQSGAIVDLSTIGSRSTIGPRSFVFNTTLPAASNVPAGTILIKGVAVGTVEW
jgi:carbonic anhydrase/acetyltransferase-like protein (isoleucine patch superfamily)